MKKEFVPEYSMSAIRSSAAEECSTCGDPAPADTFCRGPNDQILMTPEVPHVLDLLEMTTDRQLAHADCQQMRAVSLAQLPAGKRAFSKVVCTGD